MMIVFLRSASHVFVDWGMPPLRKANIVEDTHSLDRFQLNILLHRFTLHMMLTPGFGMRFQRRKDRDDRENLDRAYIPPLQGNSCQLSIVKDNPRVSKCSRTNLENGSKSMRAIKLCPLEHTDQVRTVPSCRVTVHSCHHSAFTLVAPLPTSPDVHHSSLCLLHWGVLIL